MKHFFFVLSLLAQTLHAQWVQTNGPSSGTINSLVASGPNILAANANGFMYCSTNNGTSWSHVDTLFPVDLFVESGTNLFAAAADTIVTIFRSANNGSSWTKIASFDGFLGAEVTSMAASDSIVIVAQLNRVGPNQLYTTIHVSVDNGKNWTEGVPLGIWVSGIAICGDYIFESVGPTGIIETNMPAVFSGVLRSSDYGVSWTEADSCLGGSANSLAVSGKNIFAGTDKGVFLSTNYGISWSAVNSGIPVNLAIATFAVSGPNVFAGSDKGVFLSTNNGANWTDVSTGLKNTLIFSLAVNGTNLFAGTDSGVWRRPLSEIITTVNKEENVLPQAFVLQQNYPNPFNPSTTIRYSLPTSAHVKLTLYNTLGQVVGELVNEEQSAGWKEVTWDASGISSGIYLYRLQALQRDGGQAGSFVETKNCLVVK